MRNSDTIIAGGIVVADVSDMLPTRRGGWGPRSSPIERIYVHHSGALGASGFEGLRRSAQHSVDRRRWRGTGYHYWLPYVPSESDPIIVWQANRDDRHTWHTGGPCNNHGVSLCLQGNTSARPMSDHQMELLEALLPWLRERHASTLSADRWLSWHSESAEWGGTGKPACPGRHAEEWLRAYREGL